MFPAKPLSNSELGAGLKFTSSQIGLLQTFLSIADVFLSIFENNGTVLINTQAVPRLLDICSHAWVPSKLILLRRKFLIVCLLVLLFRKDVSTKSSNKVDGV